MLKFVRPSLAIGLSGQNVTVLQTTGWRPVTSVVADVARANGDDESLAQLQATLQTALKEVKCRNARTTIVLSDDSVRYFSVVPPQNLTRLEDCKAAASMRFQALYGESPVNWTLRGDWSSSHPFLVCAIPTSLERCLQSVASSHQFSLVSVVPQFVAIWNHHRRTIGSGQWLGVIHEQSLILGAVKGGQIVAVRTTHLPDGEISADWFAQHLAREALRLDLPAPTVVQLCGDVPQSWLALSGTLTCKKIDSAISTSQPSLGRMAGMRLARAGLQ